MHLLLGLGLASGPQRRDTAMERRDTDCQGGPLGIQGSNSLVAPVSGLPLLEVPRRDSPRWGRGLARQVWGYCSLG